MPNKKKLLIVEDDGLLIQALQKTFEKEGYTVLIAKNGQEGLKTAIKNHPDLILLDIIMPVMDGITALKELRKDAWGKKAKVVMLTNIDYPADLEPYNYGIVGFLVKSKTSLDDVVKEVAKIFSSQ